MYSYLRLSLTTFMFITLSVKAMQQNAPIIKNFEQLTINAIHKPEPLLTLCIKHFGRDRQICQADGNTLGHLLSPESIIPENLALEIIKKFPTNVIKECAQEIAEKLSTALPAKMNIAFIDKLAECDAIAPCRPMLQQLINDPRADHAIKKCINHHDPLFQSMKTFLIAQAYAHKLPDYQPIIIEKQREELSPDGNYIAELLCDNDSINILTTKDNQCIAILTGHDNAIWSISWSPDGNYLATGSGDNTAKIWTVNGKCIATLTTGHDNIVWSVSWSPNGKYLVTGSADKTAKIWTIKDLQWQCIAVLTGHTATIYSASWSPDGKYLATGSADKTVKIWTLDGKCIATLTGHTASIWSLSWSPDGIHLTTHCAWDGATKKWDMHVLNTITQHPFSYDEILLIKGIVDAREIKTRYPLNQHEQQIFNQLCNIDPELRDALHGALDPLVIQNELAKKLIKHINS